MAYRDTVNKYVVLTDLTDGTGGQIWLNPPTTPVTVPFIVRFRYRAGGGTGADGLVFMFYKQDDIYDPDYGGGLGFSAMPPSSLNPVPGYGIEFDNFLNPWDPTSNHIALIEDDPGNHLAFVNDTNNWTEDNNWHDVTVGVAEDDVFVSVDEVQVLEWGQNIDRTYGGLGFSAGTGTYTNWHIIDDFCLDEFPPVGGIAELPDVSDSSVPNYVAPAGLAAVTLIALTAGAWYARRRWGK